MFNMYYTYSGYRQDTQYFDLIELFDMWTWLYNMCGLYHMRLLSNHTVKLFAEFHYIFHVNFPIYSDTAKFGIYSSHAFLFKVTLLFYIHT